MSDIFRDYSFGGWLRFYRQESKITLRDAAKRIGMDAGNLSKLERSELAPPKRASEIKRICEKLAFDNEEFMCSIAYQHHLAVFKERFFSAQDNEGE